MRPLHTFLARLWQPKHVNGHTKAAERAFPQALYDYCYRNEPENLPGTHEESQTSRRAVRRGAETHPDTPQFDHAKEIFSRHVFRGREPAACRRARGCQEARRKDLKPTGHFWPDASSASSFSICSIFFSSSRSSFSSSFISSRFFFSSSRFVSKYSSKRGVVVNMRVRDFFSTFMRARSSRSCT